MAKIKPRSAPLKPAISIPSTINNQIADAIHGKKIKPDGDNFVFLNPYKYQGQKELQAGTKLIECNDGYFKIETPAGPIDHYRVKVQFIPSNIIQKTS